MAAEGKGMATNGQEHDAEPDASAEGSSERPVPGGGPRGRGDQPRGDGNPQGQVAPIWPTFEQVVGVLYELATGLFGSIDNPFPAFRISDRRLLESAIALPHQAQYENFFDGLAAMVRSIAANHALVDGNKRLAVAVLHATLLVNGYAYLWSDQDAATIVERCAKGESDFRWLAAFIGTWAARLPTRLAIPLDAQVIGEAIAAIRARMTQAVTDNEDARRSLREMISRHAQDDLRAADAIHTAGMLAARAARAAREQEPQ